MFASSSSLLALLGIDLLDFLNADFSFCPTLSLAPSGVLFPLSLLSLHCVTALIGFPTFVDAGTQAPLPTNQEGCSSCPSLISWHCPVPFHLLAMRLV
jgi:hypothetical protein